MNDQFENVDMDDILTFLKEIKIIPKITDINTTCSIKSSY